MAEDVLVEIGLEELPARFVDDAEKQLLHKTTDWLTDLRISFNAITSYSTPRRLAVLIKGIADEQTSMEEELKGPSLHIARDQNGEWTKAAIGFTKSQGKSVDDIYTKEIKGTAYIFVKKQIIGVKTSELLPDFSRVIESIHFPKNMRWGEQHLRYARPIRWLAALYGKEIIPFSVTGVQTSNITYGHRFLGDKLTIDKPDKYEAMLEKQYVIANKIKREEMIAEGMENLQHKHGFQIPADKQLLREVCNLVEYPTVFTGTFEKSFLKLPKDVLVTSMKEHQRYFPVVSEDNELLPFFVGVRNGDDYKLETVVKGNEKVLHARLSDAQFFFDEDLKHSIEFNLEKLKSVVFQEKLGTISDKLARITVITEHLTVSLNIDNKAKEKALRAAEICKFDLPTNMVNEFTELQGIIGEIYARNFGEDQEVATAVSEHYMPVQSDGALPKSVPGAIVSIADKLDTIVGCISVGLIPTGSQDPYGLRRQAIGLLKILKAFNWNISIETLLDLTQSIYDKTQIAQNDSVSSRNELENFFKLRAMFLMKEMNIEQDIIQAVLAEQIGVVSYTIKKATILSERRTSETFKNVQEALVRVLNLSGKSDQTSVNKALFQTTSESELYDAYLLAKNAYQTANEQQDAEKALQHLGEMAGPIHAFFDHNMVMAEDEAVRENRLSLINNIASLIKDYADLSAIEWKQHF